MLYTMYTRSIHEMCNFLHDQTKSTESGRYNTSSHQDPDIYIRSRTLMEIERVEKRCYSCRPNKDSQFRILIQRPENVSMSYFIRMRTIVVVTAISSWEYQIQCCCTLH